MSSIQSQPYGGTMNQSAKDVSLPPSLREALAEHNAKADIEARGVESLKVLWDVANRDSGQCRFIAAFLLALYNGLRFPFDPTNLRCLDRALYEHCMNVLHMDARLCRQEVHCYFEHGDARFQQLAKDWQLVDHVALQQQLKAYQERFGELDSEQA